jgi:AraC family transcriptional regulator
MEPKLETIAEKKLIGKRMKMSFASNRTGELWRSFMPRRREIQNAVTNDLISLQNYSQPVNLNDFNQEFEKWAAVEVTDFQSLPDGMETFLIPAGLYAVFHYKGSSTDTSIFRYIFGEWLPASNYVLDTRPHFERLGDKYKNNDPDSEEDIWIPIKPKSVDGK